MSLGPFSGIADRIGKMQDETANLREALMLAVNMLSIFEPGDSRAVSDEFVALACVCTGDTSPDVMAVIRAALAK